MQARFMIEKPDEIQATMVITMSVKDWCDLRDKLAEKWPSARLSGAITSILVEARKVYYAKDLDALP